MIANFYNTQSDNRCLTKDLTPIPVSYTTTQVDDGEILPRVTGASADITASSQFDNRYEAWGPFWSYINHDWYNPDWDSCWLPLNTDSLPWIQYHISSAKCFNKLKMILGETTATSTHTFILQGSNDGINFTDVYTNTFTAVVHEETTLEYSFDSEEAYECIRIQFDSALYDPYVKSLYITDIEVNGYHIESVPNYDLDVVFKDDESREDPRLILSYNSHIAEANYVKLNNHYYYIMGLTYSQQRIILQLHEDVLMTYRDKILKLGVILDRQENAGNPYLKDSEMPVLAKRNVQCKIFTSGFSDYTYILATTGA